MKKLLIKNIGVLATPIGNTALAGEAQGAVKYIEDAFIYVEGGVIKAVGAAGDCAAASVTTDPDVEVLDAEGCLVTPGLVDAHTHLVFGGWRQNELDQKLKGASYLDILAAGGGILSTVRATRDADLEELAEKAEDVLIEMFGYGVTTCEAKSGYGLNLETELKQLEAVKLLSERNPVELVSTFMGAHAVPSEYKEKREDYINLLLEEMLPVISEKGLAEFCDVFCEAEVFTKEESLRILERAKELGLGAKIHTDEIFDIGGTEIAERVSAISAEHLIKCSDEGIGHLKNGNTVACLLPATSFYLGADYARAKDMIKAGVPVAIATDFNPGSCPVSNIQLAMNIGCLKYRMAPEEILTAVTLNGAAAIGRAGRIGSIEVGKQADIVVWAAPDLAYLCYRMGSNPVNFVIKKGIVYE